MPYRLATTQCNTETKNVLKIEALTSSTRYAKSHSIVNFNSWHCVAQGLQTVENEIALAQKRFGGNHSVAAAWTCWFRPILIPM